SLALHPVSVEGWVLLLSEANCFTLAFTAVDELFHPDLELMEFAGFTNSEHPDAVVYAGVNWACSSPYCQSQGLVLSLFLFCKFDGFVPLVGQDQDLLFDGGEFDLFRFLLG